MIQGTTPVHTFGIPLDATTIKKARVTYSQNNKVVLTKEGDDCTITDGSVVVKLTQEETFLFDADIPVDVQLRILTNTDDAVASRPQRVPLRTVLDGEVLG